MSVLVAFLLIAQAFVPMQAYTTADPVSPDRLGLATIDGRYMIELGAGCDGLEPGVNVEIVSIEDDTATLARDSQACTVRVIQQMSTVPCFQIEDVCDVAAEQFEP